jgi:hypothetical protein
MPRVALAVVFVLFHGNLGDECQGEDCSFKVNSLLQAQHTSADKSAAHMEEDAVNLREGRYVADESGHGRDGSKRESRFWNRRRTPAPTPAPTHAAVGKDQRIAIVGAGPAGLHVASRLKHLGFTKITLFEKTDRVGGKSLTIYRNAAGQPCEQELVDGTMDTSDCVAHEMGTCYLHNGYHHVRWLLEEYGLKSVVPPEGRAVWWQDVIDDDAPADITQFVVAGIQKMVSDGRLSKPFWVPESAFPTYALLSAVSDYNTLYQNLFGTVKFTMPDRPSDDALQKIDMTFEEFLVKHNLHALIPFAALAQTAQGYGYVKTIPAFYGLQWMKPEILAGFVQQSLHSKTDVGSGALASWLEDMIAKVSNMLVGGNAAAVQKITTMIPEGYNKLWKRIHEQDQLDVRFNVTIADSGIHRPDSGPITITYSQNGGDDITAEYDILIYTGPHALAERYVDVTSEEKDIFQHLSNYVLMTTLYESEPVPGYSDEKAIPIMYRYSTLDGGSEDDGEWYSDRDAHSIFAANKPRQATGKQWRVAYQFYEKPCEQEQFDQGKLCDAKYQFPSTEGRFKEFQLPDQLARLQARVQQKNGNVAHAEQFPWPYFWHFDSSAIAAGKPWDLFDMQGTKNTFWLGASAVFESVHDVINYNLQILDAHFGGQFHGDMEYFKQP